MSSLKEFLSKLRKESDEDNLVNIEFGLTLEIDEKVFQKVMYWINKSDFEVSGLGKVIYDRSRNVLKVIDACLVKQENTSATTELEGAGVGKAMYLLKDTPGDLRWWWHSHVNMPVFWSGTDMTAIKSLGGAQHDNPAWFCMTVFNKDRNTKSAFVQNNPVKLITDDVPTKVVLDHSTVADWDKEYEENVEEKSYTSSYSSLISGDFAERHWPSGKWDSTPGWLADRVKSHIKKNESEEEVEEVEVEDDGKAEFTQKVNAEELAQMSDEEKREYFMWLQENYIDEEIDEEEEKFDRLLRLDEIFSAHEQGDMSSKDLYTEVTTLIDPPEDEDIESLLSEE